MDAVRSVIPEQQPRFRSDEKLWCVGDTALLHKNCVAIVGTRNVSRQGAARARRLAREVEEDVVVVSGLAKGVDTEALTAAIEAKGNVDAVVGTLIDRADPAESPPLQEGIYHEHPLVSQFAPGHRCLSEQLPGAQQIDGCPFRCDRDHRGRGHVRHSSPSG